jgi:RNA polymerase sigma factor (sigma-70 family)
MPDLFLGTVLRHARRALTRHTPPTADAVLLDRFARNRDEAAFAELVARHGPGVWAACRRGAGTEADAQDAFQATFMVLARRANRVRRASSVGSWLFGVAVRLSRKTHSRVTRTRDPARLPRPADATDPLDGAAWSEMVAVLDEEMARLPEALRAPLLCCYYHGLTQDEAAHQLGWKVRTLKARVDRGRKLLRARLTRRGIELSAALAAIGVASEGSSFPPVVRLPSTNPVPVAVHTLTREGLAMTRRTTPLVLTACAVGLVAAGAGLLLGQGKPPAPLETPGSSSATPTAPAAAKVDAAGDPLPPGAIARLGTTRFRFPGYDYQVFFLPEGDRVVWLNEGSTATYWDVVTGSVTTTFTDKDLFRAQVELSPDGERLALFGMPQTDKKPGPTTLRLYDLKASKTLWTVIPTDLSDRANGQAVRFSPDGKQLFTLRDGEVRVWNVADGTEVRRERISGEALAVSPDGKTVAIASRSGLFLWDSTGNDRPRQIGGKGRQDGFEGAVFAPDGKTVRAIPSYGNVVPEFEVATGRRIGQMELRHGFSLNPDGSVVAVPEDSMVGGSKPRSALVLKDVKTGKELRRLSTESSNLRGGGPKQGIGALWSKDGSRVATVAGERLWVWDTATGKLLSPTKPGHDGMIGDLTFAPDGRVFTAGNDNTIRAWETATGKELYKLSLAGWAKGVAVSPDGSLLAGNGTGDDFRVWDARTGKEVFKLLGHGRIGGQRRIRFSADDQTLLSYGDDYYVRAWDMATGKLKAEVRYWPRFALAPGQTEEEAEAQGGGHLDRVMDLGSDGNTFIQSRGKDVEVIAVDTHKERARFEADPQFVAALAVSPDGKRLVTAGRGVPPPAKGQFQDRGNGPTEYVVTVWDLGEFKQIVRFRVVVPIPMWWGPLAFTPDGKRVVTGAYEPVLRFFDANTGDAVGTIELPNRPESLAFDGPGKQLAVGFVDTTALVYDVAAAMKPAKKE